MKRTIVNCAIGGHYRALQPRLQAACETHCPEAKLMFWQDYPTGCQPHPQQQYGFKIHAIQAAIDSGAERVLWIDCTFIPTASIEPLWDVVETEGWYAPKQGDSKLGTWATDTALEIYGINRDEAMQVPMVFSGLVGLNLTPGNVGSEVLRRWRDLYQRGAFNGPHRNIPGEPVQLWGNKLSGHCSNDPRCEGHRHDEAALSFVLHSLGLVPRRHGFLTLETPEGFIARNFAQEGE